MKIPTFITSLESGTSRIKGRAWLSIKQEVITFHHMKAYRGNRGTAPLILNISTRWPVVNFTRRPFYPRESSPVPIEQEAPEPV
jgi:hypothetical protein